MTRQQYKQFRLRSGDSELTCWLPYDPRVKKGSWIDLKDIPDVHWQVIDIYETILDQHPLKRWRVGGLE